MFNSVVLDVFISLALLYLLYSLLVSIVGEMIANYLGIRARLLRKTLETMLNDGYTFDKRHLKIFQSLGSFFLYEYKHFQFSFAGRFYNHPSIKYLTQGQKKHKISFKQGKPAYITRENFSDTIVQLFRNKGNGIDDMEKINFALKFNTLHIDPQSLANFRNLLADSNNDLKTFKAKLIQWYDETNDRTNGWFKRKMQFIVFWLGFILAVAFNVDSIKIAKQLASDKDARNQMVELGIQASDTNSRIGKAIKKTGDTVTSDSLLRKSYHEAKKATDEANKVLGLGWQLENQLKTSSIEREIYPSTLRYIRKSLVDPSVRLKKDIILCKTKINTTKSKEIKSSNLKILKEKTQALKSIISRFNNIAGTGFTLDDALHSDVIDSLSNPMVVSFSGQRHLTFPEQTGYVICQSMPWHLSFWGFVITALMLSLGAPFWFDLLKKLVSIRSSGVNPDEKKAQNTTDNLSPLKQELPSSQTSSSDPVAIALSKNRQYLESITGVIAVNYDYTINNGIKSPCIEVSVESWCDQTRIPKQVAVILNNKEHLVDIFVTNTQCASFHMALNPMNASSGIQNIVYQGTDVGWGTASGLVINSKTKKKAILSCAHVMAGNNTNNKLDGKCSILNNENNTVATLMYHLQSNTIDVAFADSTGKSPLPYTPIKNYGTVSKADAEKGTAVIMNGFISGEVDGIIVNDSVQFPFNVDGKPYLMVNLIKLTQRNGSKDLGMSRGGDSGALLLRKEDKMPLGIIIGGTDYYSYAISLENIFDSCYIEPIK